MAEEISEIGPVAEVRRVLPAPPHEVFAAWTEAGYYLLSLKRLCETGAGHPFEAT